MLRTSSHLFKVCSHYLLTAMLSLFLLSLATPALAHRVLVYAFSEGDTIHTESKFVGSGPVQKGQVIVQDKKTGQDLVTGTTDDQGKFSFKVPTEAAAQKMDLLIVVEASMGHQGEWLLKADSYLAGGKSTTAAAGPGVSTSATPTPSISPSLASEAKAASLEQQALEAALNKSLERHLAPLKEMLTDLTIHRTSFTDIIGGLGYIMGIFGVWAYFMSKKAN